MKAKSLSLLITGSSGQIGTNLALRALADGWQVLGLDFRPNTWSDAIPTVVHDLRDHSIPLTDILAPCLPAAPLDCVVHLAAHAKVHELVTYPERALENIAILFPVLEFCREHRIPLVFGSSREVYADIQRTITMDHTREEHADFAFAASPYSASKIAGEALILCVRPLLRSSLSRFSVSATSTAATITTWGEWSASYRSSLTASAATCP